MLKLIWLKVVQLQKKLGSYLISFIVVSVNQILKSESSNSDKVTTYIICSMYVLLQI